MRIFFSPVASPSLYYERWKLNRELAENFAAALPSGADWEIVLRFYASLHLVEGYQRTKAQRFWAESHSQRRVCFRLSPEILATREVYADLEDLSRQVRYDPGFMATAEDFGHAKTWAGKVEAVVRSKFERALNPSS